MWLCDIFQVKQKQSIRKQLAEILRQTEGENPDTPKSNYSGQGIEEGSLSTPSTPAQLSAAVNSCTDEVIQTPTAELFASATTVDCPDELNEQQPTSSDTVSNLNTAPLEADMKRTSPRK